MFEIGKKGADKGQASTASSQQTPAARPSHSEPPVKRAAAREPAMIGPSIRIDGDVRGEEDLLIDGEVTGTVQLKGNNLVIGGQGRVRANVYAQSIDVEGLMEGDLFGSERVNVRKSAQVTGNITAPRVSIEDGAQFKGSIEMNAPATEASADKGRGSVAALNGGAKSAAPAIRPSGDTDPAGSATVAR